MNKLIKKLYDISSEYSKSPISAQRFNMIYDEIEKLGVYLSPFYGKGMSPNNDTSMQVWRNIPVKDIETDEDTGILYSISIYSGYTTGNKEYVLNFYLDE